MQNFITFLFLTGLILLRYVMYGYVQILKQKKVELLNETLLFVMYNIVKVYNHTSAIILPISLRS